MCLFADDRLFSQSKYAELLHWPSCLLFLVRHVSVINGNIIEVTSVFNICYLFDTPFQTLKTELVVVVTVETTKMEFSVSVQFEWSFYEDRRGESFLVALRRAYSLIDYIIITQVPVGIIHYRFSSW